MNSALTRNRKKRGSQSSSMFAAAADEDKSSSLLFEDDGGFSLFGASKKPSEDNNEVIGQVSLFASGSSNLFSASAPTVPSSALTGAEAEQHQEAILQAVRKKVKGDEEKIKIFKRCVKRLHKVAAAGATTAQLNEVKKRSKVID